MSDLVLCIPNDEAMLRFGNYLAAVCKGRGVIFLRGNLGAGKTTVSRGLIQGLGHQGAVKSPTFTLVEPYQLACGAVWHFDLYRLADPEELEFLGIRDYFAHDELCLIEWPEQGAGMLPEPDLALSISAIQDVEGRTVQVSSHTERGRTWSKQLAEHLQQESWS